MAVYRVSLVAQLGKNPPAMRRPGLISGSERSSGEGISYPLQYSWASLVAQLVKNAPTMPKTWVLSMIEKIPWRRERLPYSGLENSIDCVVLGVTKSQT